ncbi:hypothetical protein [Pseudogemmobacter faecipullorum]|uniref:TnsA endonuclease N-terminal domain-containing protein n=1 Tax=Pseudogemmobacter faecipullorum TaxID=2755041 RepID=A0ABS8CS99_9RHOB|nr:hypothetical protein [Pseudogemmobacter faecipullorum]MCB5412262.1 hypothetical protein [Pseudogemmobacter faecipullorum]
MSTVLPRSAIGSDANGSLLSSIGGRVVLRPMPEPSRAQRAVHKVSERHFTGQICWGEEHPKRLVVESLLEYQAALCTIYRPGFEDIREQVGPVMLPMPDGGTNAHYIDFCATFRGGLRIALVVKPEVYSRRPEFQEKIAALVMVGRPVLFDRLVVIGRRNINPDELANAELFHASRVSVPAEDQALQAFISGMSGPASIGQLIAEGRADGITLRSVARAIHRERLHLITPGRITLQSSVAQGKVGVLS